MIEIVEYIPTKANHWQVNVSNSHCPYGRIHWHSKCINLCTYSPLVRSNVLSKVSNHSTKSNVDQISCDILFAENYQFIIHRDFTISSYVKERHKHVKILVIFCLLGNIKILRIFIKLIQLLLPLMYFGHCLWQVMENLLAIPLWCRLQHFCWTIIWT